MYFTAAYIYKLRHAQLPENCSQ